jgi:lipid-A-disaccharide synthase
MVSALDHSANIHLKAVMENLDGKVEFTGIFDAALGTPYMDISALAVMGFSDVINKLPFFLKLQRKMVELSEKADKVLLLDSSGFNLPLAKKIRKNEPHKIIIYYILPQAWAWKKKRIPVLEETITSLASILPFESDFYSKSAPIEYVGHPLLDEIPKYKSKVENNGKIAFMPGSRAGEIRRLMPVFKELRAQIDCEAYLVVPRNFEAEKIKNIYGSLTGFKIVHNAHETLYECGFAFICSGTATLEAALIGIPFVLSYTAKPLDYIIAEKVVKIKYIGLANILFDKCKGEPMHPELIQKDVTSKNLLYQFRTMNKDVFFEKSRQLKSYLKQGSAARVAQIIEDSNGN